MTNQGDDCYFFYYSTCTKGDSCPFRHCEAAMGSETVCSLWQENRCFRNVCKFRHMDIKKNRKEIACYWENQPSGCQKTHCAFYHEKARFIDGLFVPANKGPVVWKEKEEEIPKEDLIPSVPAPVSTATNPQLRGVIKAENQESVPSPTHPPVVINPVDDEDDEDDQFSEEGDDASGVSPRKVLNKDDSLNFGVKTLEEIRLAKALKGSLNRAEPPFLQGSDGFTSIKQRRIGTEMENIRSVLQPAVDMTKIDPSVFEEPGKRKVTERLGIKFNRENNLMEDGPKLRGALAKRLGGFVDSPEEQTDLPPQKLLRPVHERLGINSDLAAPKSPNTEPSGEIRIKTLEEIRQEKAAKSQIQHQGARVVTEVSENPSSPPKRGNKPAVGSRIKTFSEILHEKKKLQEEKVSQEDGSSPKGIESPANAGVEKVAAQEGEVRVKTLEEIRREKAARMQAQDQESQNSTSDQGAEKGILCIGKNSATNSSSQKQPQDSGTRADCVEVSVVANGKSDLSSQAVTVKSFEEIMREKRLRKQQDEQAASAVIPEQAAQKPSPAVSVEKPTTIGARITPPAASGSDAESSNQARAPARLRLGVKRRALSPESQSTAAKDDVTSPKTSVESEVVEATTEIHTEKPLAENTPAASKTSPSKAAEKVRPKLNVKPSVMKPAAQVIPGQKRKASGSSAVAAVKPLNANPESEPLPKRITTCSSEAEASTQQVANPAEQSVSLTSKTTTSGNEPPSVQHSPVVRTPSQSRLRRASHNPAGISSTKDDFEDLLDEFTDDKLDGEIELDPGKGEDDLLLELSEMIG
ncbi:zinc finger CCCH domain-containing protein 11A isoform X2 [Trichomycterus rosablanca]|uniref:zinc finger CCCH domain-containing protein 11A isoform X2 n=1 Tax=Trichomycterus rosablanca TaxID=2290929 RepID=UPI002F3521D8